MKTKIFISVIVLLTSINIVFAQDKKGDSTTVKQVIEKYITAIGGRDSLANIKDKTTVLRGSVSGIDVSMVIYQKLPDKIKQEINAGAVNQVIKYDGKKAMMTVGENSRELTGSTLEGLRYEAMLNFILKLDELKVGLKLLGKVKVDNKDAYEVEMKYPSGNIRKEFYDVKSGLKVKSSKTINTPQGSFAQTSYYGDYKPVAGVKYPFSIKQTVGPQSLDFKVSSIKINTGLKDSKFKVE
ncbi:MAG TPA: hypothetical protein ENI76_07300 [Ignavibacteria bacterium]|nr:hypothetical protein [Ignavibacteria bacterium]